MNMRSRSDMGSETMLVGKTADHKPAASVPVIGITPMGLTIQGHEDEQAYRDAGKGSTRDESLLLLRRGVRRVMIWQAVPQGASAGGYAGADMNMADSKGQTLVYIASSHPPIPSRTRPVHTLRYAQLATTRSLSARARARPNPGTRAQPKTHQFAFVRSMLSRGHKRSPKCR